ncbi:glycosyltransferase family 2 protein [Arhodomonas sp. AD133]|uniref:glycosyltransferase family 2 protein n=1 Tax=Arhodomonas sp. AD133 TaxID=3415009 RepID=UPI003EC03AA9
MSTVDDSFELFRRSLDYYRNGFFERAVAVKEKYQEEVDYYSLWQSDRRSDVAVTVTFVVVSHKGRQGLVECIDSLLAQEDPDFEIVLVDNGGNEGVWGELKTRRLLHVAPPMNVFPSEGRNIGGEFARGEYIAFIDDDALVDRGYVTSLKYAWKNFEFSAIRGRVLPKGGAGNEDFVGHYDLGQFPVPAVLITEGNMAIPASVFREVGGFDPLVFGGEGTELTYRCQKMFPQRDIFYWPGIKIYHDYAAGANLAAKKARHALSRRYFRYLAPEINGLQKQYGRWYQRRPGAIDPYDRRGTVEKLRARISEMSMAAARWLPRGGGGVR